MTTFDLAFDPHEPRDAIGRWTKSPGSFVISAQNIVARWDQSTAGEREAGRTWYPEAHRAAVELGKQYGVSTEEAAALLAEYSPQTRWGLNQIEASEVLRKHRGVGGPFAAMWFNTGTPNLDARRGVMASGVQHQKADRILAGEDFDVVTAGQNKSGSIPPKALKIRAFYHLIASGGQDDPSNPRVVIDRHAMSVAYGRRITEDEYSAMHPGSGKKYLPFVQAYVEAARIISKRTGQKISPEQVQATTWLAQQRLNGEGTEAKALRSQKLGERDWNEWLAYAAKYLQTQTTGAKVGYSDLAHEVGPRPDADRDVRALAAILVNGGSRARQATAVHGLLKRWGVSKRSAELALQISRRGTTTIPNARLAEHAADEILDEHGKQELRVVANHDMYFRAAYVANAAKRIQLNIDNGMPEREALRREGVNFARHEAARKDRLRAVSQVQVTGEMFGQPDDDGTLVGWYHNPFLNNEAECLAASGHNFYVEEGTSIGLPGSVHANCGCYAGPPHVGMGMVDDAVKKVVKFKPRQTPTFKLKTGRRRHTA